MDLTELTNEELCEEWRLFNTILTECNQSQSQYDIEMRDRIESEIVRRGGAIESSKKACISSICTQYYYNEKV